MYNKGGCFCGAARFKVEGEPLRMGQCHCDACRKPSGTGHFVQAFFMRDQVKIDGLTQTYDWVADSGSARKWHFCPTCGSRLFSENSKRPDNIGIAAGAFDNSDWFKPEFRVYSHNKPVWDVVDDQIEVRS